jgi:diguanylate cyclase (GGDEF)-like protein
MKRQHFLSLMKDRFPHEYLTYVDSIKAQDRQATAEVLKKMIGLIPKAEREEPFAIKLGLDLSTVLYYKCDYALALRKAGSYLKLAAKLGDSDTLADAEYLMGWLLNREHRTGEAVQHLKRCIAIAEKLGIILLILNANIELANSAAENGNLQNELEILKKAEKMAKKAKAPIQELHIMLSIATLYNDIAEHKASLQYMKRVMSKFRFLKGDAEYYEIFSAMLNNLEPQILVRYAIICLRQGKLEELIQYVRQLEQLNVGFEGANPRQALFILAALACFELGRTEDGHEFLGLALSEDITYNERPYTEVFIMCHRLMEILLENKRPDAAELLLRRIKKSILAQDSAGYGRIYWRMRACYCGYIGDSPGRLEALEEYMSFAEAHNSEKDEAFKRGMRNQIKLAEELERTEKQKKRQQKMLESVVADKETADYLSEHDGLTGLNNRNKLNKDRLSRQFKDMKSCGVIFFDVNELKLTNDVFGHEVGDKLLTDMAQSIKNFDNERYHAYRMGGDEFMLIIRDCGEEELDMVYEKWQKDMESHNSRADIRCVVAAGCAYGSGSFDLNELIRLADERMYENKRAIKNQESRAYRIGK